MLVAAHVSDVTTGEVFIEPGSRTYYVKVGRTGSLTARAMGEGSTGGARLFDSEHLVVVDREYVVHDVAALATYDFSPPVPNGR